MNRSLDKLLAILRRDLLTAIRHRSGFVLTAFGVLTELAAFYYLSRAVGPGFRPDGVDYFPFLLIGTGLYTFFVMSAQAFLSSVQEAQQTGTLEVLMTTSTAPAELLLLSAVSAFAGSLVNLLLYLGVGVALFRAAIHPNLLACAVVLCLSIVIAGAIGILVAAFQVEIQKGSALLWLLGSGFWFISGTMFSIRSLPPALLVIAHALPFTYAIDGTRAALLEGRPVHAMAPTLAALAAFGLLFFPVALGALSLSLRRARRFGTLSSY